MRRILATAVLAAVAVTTGCASTPPPVSAKVQAAYDKALTATPTPEADTNLVTVVGDSYVYGSNMGGQTIHNWTFLAEAGLQGKLVTDVVSAGVGGSGYVTRGPKDKVFSEILPVSVGPKNDLVVFFGSRNDRGVNPKEVAAAAADAYTEARKLAPKAKLLVIGPAWTDAQVPDDVLAIRDALKSAAKTAGASWVDPIAERWFFDQPALIGSDGVHPTDEGHAYMAKLLLPYLRAAVEASAKG